MNEPSKTPLTDELTEKHGRDHRPVGMLYSEMKLHARSLELQLAEAKAENARWREFAKLATPFYSENCGCNCCVLFHSLRKEVDSNGGYIS